MRTLLVLADHPELPEAIRSAVNPEQYRIVHRSTVEEAEPLLNHGLVDACILDVELTSVQGMWPVEKLRRRNPRCHLLIYTGERWEWEEEAYLQGVRHVLTKPVRPRLLNAVLDRLWTTPSTHHPLPEPALETFSRVQPPPPGPPAGGGQTLAVLRNFSGILTHSLDAEGMLRQFLVLLRDILSINRAAIFLRQPLAGVSASSAPGEVSRSLRSAGALGLSSGLLEHFELSLDSGIGAQVQRLGRILRRYSEETRTDIEAQKEFELLGAQVAIPILDRESLLGVAVFDGRITGEPLVNSELELIFHLLEQLALAIKNIWLHGQLSSNHEMMTGILRELSSGCVVVSRELSILHANKTARRYFARADRRGAEFGFTDLPQVLGAKIYQVLKTGAAVASFRYEPSSNSVYSISVVPFQRQSDGLPASALLIAEDLTQHEQLQTLEIESANLRLVKTIAERLTNEIGNALVPLSTHQQLLAAKWKDPEFRSSLESAMSDTVKRISRLTNQMKFLARDQLLGQEAFPAAALVQEAFNEATQHQSGAKPQLNLETDPNTVMVTGDRVALKHALSELMLNALQANPKEPKIGVRLHTRFNGKSEVRIEVLDNGAGFTTEAAKNAAAPFYSTRVVGLGLGLAVSRKIVENHHGKLEIVPPEGDTPGLVRVSLPVESGPGVHL